MNRESTMAIKLTVKEGNNERSWDVMDGQQIDINMAKGAEYTLIDTQTGQTPDGMRVVNNHGQTQIYGSDTFPWVTLHDEGADEPAAPARIEQTFEPAPPAAPAAEENIALAEAPPAEASDAPRHVLEHIQADEIGAPPPNADFEGAPSGGSMLLAGGGALLLGGLSAALSGGSSGGSHHHDEDTSFAPRPPAEPEPITEQPQTTVASATNLPTPYTLNMNGENLDFNNVLQNGKLDASNHQHDNFTLNAGDLLAKATSLTLDGDYGDHLDLSGGGWTQDANNSHYDNYRTYHHGNFTLRVEDDISVSII